MDNKRYMASVMWLFAIRVVLLIIVISNKAEADCDVNSTIIDITTPCTRSSCLGECSEDGTCCLEQCYDGSIRDMVLDSADSCGQYAEEHTVITCSYFENMTRCAANYMDRDFDTCWRQVLYELTKIKGTFSEFNPLNCPCESSFVRVDGQCDYLQCENSTLCETVPDTVRGISVCCIHQEILPTDIECGNFGKLDITIYNNHNVSTLEQCEARCVDGVCVIPDTSSLPACCKSHRDKTDKSDEQEDKLHGTAVFAIVIVSILLVIVGGFALVYICRTKLGGNSRHRMQQREGRNYELSDVLKSDNPDNNKDIFDTFQVASAKPDYTDTEQQQQHQQQQDSNTDDVSKAYDNTTPYLQE